MTKIQLIQVLKALFPSALETLNFVIAVDPTTGDATIAMWDNTLGTQPTGTALTTELNAILLAQAQTIQVAIIVAASQAVTYANVSYMSTTFQVNLQQLQNVVYSLTQAATPAGLPTGFKIYDTVGPTAVAMTLTQLQGLYNLMFTQLYNSYVKAEDYVAAIFAATTVADVQAIVWV